MKVRIDSAEVHQRNGISQRTNKPYSMVEQRAFLMGDLLRFEFKITLDEGQQPYPVGEYEVDLERSLSPGSYGRLEFRPRLQAVKSATAIFPKTGTNG